MQSVLNQLNSVPGVVGTMVCDPEGRLLAQAFPALFDAPMLHEAAKALSDATAGLKTAAGSVGMVDLRYRDARVVLKPLAGANMLFLCNSSLNLQSLAISSSVAVPKLERLVASRAAAPQGSGAGAARPSQLYETVQKINSAIARKKLEPSKTRGAIALKAGFALGCIDATTTDDPEKLSRLKAAASAVIGEPF